MEIKNTTAHTLDTLMEYNRRHRRGYVLTVTIVICALTAIMLSVLFFHLILFAFGVAEAPALGTVTICGVYLILSLCLLIGVPLLRRRHCRKQAAVNTMVEFVFTEDHFALTSTSDTATGHIECKYDTIIRIKESKHLFYLYIQPNAAYLVRKDGFTEGNEEDFRLLLRTVVDSKKLRIK